MTQNGLVLASRRTVCHGSLILMPQLPISPITARLAPTTRLSCLRVNHAVDPFYHRPTKVQCSLGFPRHNSQARRTIICSPSIEILCQAAGDGFVESKVLE